MSITFSPMTLGEPKTQKTSYASRPHSSTAATRKDLSPTSYRWQGRMTVDEVGGWAAKKSSGRACGQGLRTERALLGRV